MCFVACNSRLLHGEGTRVLISYFFHLFFCIFFAFFRGIFFSYSKKITITRHHHHLHLLRRPIHLLHLLHLPSLLLHRMEGRILQKKREKKSVKIFTLKWLIRVLGLGLKTFSMLTFIFTFNFFVFTINFFVFFGLSATVFFFL